MRENIIQDQLKTCVLSCEPLKDPNHGECHRITLKDTILFPEGGGQPDDKGEIDSVPVFRVQRENNEAVHYTMSALPVGQEVVVRVDWKRRFDHMQQHSAQHLITAIADSNFSAPTTSWWLGESSSYIELDIEFGKFTDAIADEIEEIANEYIIQGQDVTVNVYEEGDERLKEAKTRGLPEGHKGQVRVISMAGLDNNMCCGTHVKNLGHLQAVKILGFEKGKKGKTNLHFVAGGRLLKTLSLCLMRQKQLGFLLKNGPEEHVMLVEKLQKSLKTSEKTCSILWKEAAKVEAEKVKALSEQPKFYEVYRKDAGPEFVSTFVNEVKELAKETLFFIVSAEEKDEGQITLVGPAGILSDLGARVAELLGGKGALAGGRFQAKVTKIKKRKEAINLIKSQLQC